MGAQALVARDARLPQPRTCLICRERWSLDGSTASLCPIGGVGGGASTHSEVRCARVRDGAVADSHGQLLGPLAETGGHPPEQLRWACDTVDATGRIITQWFQTGVPKWEVQADSPNGRRHGFSGRAPPLVELELARGKPALSAGTLSLESNHVSGDEPLWQRRWPRRVRGG